MSKVRFHIATSLDGCVAGPNQTQGEPLGQGGEALHEWAFELAAWREPHGREGGEVNASSPVIEERQANVGAGLMGRGMFGPVAGGDWGDVSWEGWWGDDPPYHHHVFVLTHHERQPLEMEGGTTFHFVTDGIESALKQARNAAGDKDIQIHGGGSVARQYLNAGVVDEFELDVAPLVLPGGVRLFEGIDPDLKIELVRAVEAPGVTHLKYRLVG